MIEFDYTLTVDMGTVKKVHRPQEGVPRKLKNIFRLQGPNSSGKSTLMNMIALTSHGLKKGKIPDSIKTRMEELVKPGYKDLEFELCIEDPVTRRALKSTKKMGDPEVIVRESIDGGNSFSIIAADQFEKKYNLIYDIPGNPVGRLNELTREINDIQISFYKDVRSFQIFIEEVSKGVNDSRSPNDIKALEDDYEFRKNQLEGFNLDADRIFVEKLNKLMIATMLKELDNNAKEADSLYKKFIKETKGSTSSKLEKNYISDVKKLNDSMMNLNRLKIDLVTNATKCNYDKIGNLREAMDNVDSDPDSVLESKGISQSVVQEIIKVRDFSEGIISSSDGEALKAMSELIRVLKQYLDKNLTLPEIGPLDKFLDGYQKTYIQMSSNYDVEVLNNLISTANNILNSITGVNRLISEIVPPERDQMESFETESKEIRLKGLLDSTVRTRSKYVNDISAPAGINLSNLDKSLVELNSFFNNKYVNKKYNEIKKDHDNYETEYSKQNKELEKIKKGIGDLKIKIDKERRKEESEYIEYATEIERLQNEVTVLRSLFLEAKNKLKMIDDKSYGDCPKDDPFLKSMWTYLGKRLKNVRHLDKEYTALEVNLIEGIITTNDGTIIHLSDMGSGQSQLSYLKGLLSVDDDRIIIALFDEVSTMTGLTIGALIDEFEMLQKKGKLMVGMTVSPADEIKVDQYGI